VDLWSEEGPSAEYRAWVHAALKEDASFAEAFSWLQSFGHVLGIAPVSFAALEAAFASPVLSGLLAELHAKLLGCLGCAGVKAENWPRRLSELLLHGDDEETAAAFKDALKLAARLPPPPYPTDVTESAGAGDDEGGGGDEGTGSAASPMLHDKGAAGHKRGAAKGAEAGSQNGMRPSPRRRRRSSSPTSGRPCPCAPCCCAACARRC
jgi:hypothetical protein